MGNDLNPLSKKATSIIAGIILVIIIGLIAFLLFRNTTPQLPDKRVDANETVTKKPIDTNNRKKLPELPSEESDSELPDTTPSAMRRPLRALSSDTERTAPELLSMAGPVKPAADIPSMEGQLSPPNNNLPGTSGDQPKPSTPAPDKPENGGNDTPPTPPTISITLSAPEATSIHIGNSFYANNYVNASASNGKDISDLVYAESDVNTQQEGSYLVVYFVSYKGITASCRMSVSVINDAPIFTGTDNTSIEVSSTFDPNSGVFVTDTEDGSLDYELTGNVDVFVPGVYPLTYTAQDKYGKSTTITRIVTVFSEKPKFSGIENAAIEAGTFFDPDAGVSVTSKYGPVIYSISGIVDTNTIGSYTLIYRSTNLYNETTELSRVITVTADAPSFTGIEDLSIYVGTAFNPRAGVSVSDKYGTNTYTIDGSVDTDTPGVYAITYHSINLYGASATQTRTITVTQLEANPDSL